MYPEVHSTAEWNNRIAFDMALCLEGSGFALDEMLETHQINKEQLYDFNQDKLFLKTVQAYREEIREKGLTFRMKAKAQAEDLLTTSWNLIHADDVAASVKADLIKWTAKMGNLEPKGEEGQTDLSGGVKITINLGQNTQNPSLTSTPGLKTIDGSPATRP